MSIDMSGMSRNFLPKLLGKIAIGRKNASGWPEKVDYFLFTHPFDTKLNAAPIHKEMTTAMKALYPEAVDKEGLFKPRSIKVVLPFHNVDEVFYTSFCNYTGKSYNCKSEDGITATRKLETGEKKEVPCVHGTCEWKYTKVKDKMVETCKATGLLSVMILDGSTAGGFWRFATRSSTSTNEILSTLQMLYNIRGSLMGLEVELKVRVVSMDTPKEGGGTQKQNVPIVSIELPYSWKALANGSGTVYGDFQEILKAAKSTHALPNKALINELSMSLVDETVTDTTDEKTLDVISASEETETKESQASSEPLPDDKLF